MKAIKFIILFAAFLVSVILAQRTAFAYYACGAGPCNGSYPCNAPYSCSGGVCGASYDACVGQECKIGAGWGCSTSCTNPGSTNSASWTVCTAPGNCGPGANITCNCTTVNNCPAASCSGAQGTGNCGDTKACCLDQTPQVAPSNVLYTQKDCLSPAATATISWDYTDTGDGCGNAWGYNCSGNTTKNFVIKEGVTTLATIASPTKTADVTFTSWGSHTINVCASNGTATDNCTTTNLTLTQPVCSVSGQSPTSNTCYKNAPEMSAVPDSCSDQAQFLISGAGSCDSGWTSSPWTCSSALGTGSYTWSARAQSTSAPLAKCSTPALPAGYAFQLDQTNPNVPIPTIVQIADGTCPNTFSTRVSWDVVTDSGCGNSSITYEANVATNDTYANLVPTIATGTREVTTSDTRYGNSTVYVRAKAIDNVGNDSGWSAGATTPVTIPLPTLYPTIHISGSYQEDTGSCNPMTIDPANLNLSLSISNPTGVTYTCDKGPAGGSVSYSCDITIDNQSAQCVVPNHTVTLTASYSGYAGVEWRAGNVCSGVQSNSININAASPAPVTSDLFLVYGSQGWFKTSSTSFVNKSARTNTIPNTVAAYDSDDDTSKHVIAKVAGSVLNASSLELGANAKVNGQTEYSTNNWSSPNYEPAPIFSPTKMIDYVKSRKKYILITNQSEITADGIYFVEGNINIDDVSVFNNKKVLLIVSGSLTLDTPSHTFIPSSGSVALMADIITINSLMSQVDAIVIGNTVDIGTSATKLKINGNLVQLTDNTPFTNTRVNASVQTPSLFIKLNPATYMDLLPYLSISLYDWRQLQ